MTLGEYLKYEQKQFEKKQPWWKINEVFYCITDLPDYFCCESEALNKMASQVLRSIVGEYVDPDHLDLKFSRDLGKGKDPYIYTVTDSKGRALEDVLTPNVHALLGLVRKAINKSNIGGVLNAMTPRKLVWIGKH